MQPQLAARAPLRRHGQDNLVGGQRLPLARGASRVRRVWLDAVGCFGQRAIQWPGARAPEAQLVVCIEEVGDAQPVGLDPTDDPRLGRVELDGRKLGHVCDGRG